MSPAWIGLLALLSLVPTAWADEGDEIDPFLRGDPTIQRYYRACGLLFADLSDVDLSTAAARAAHAESVGAWTRDGQALQALLEHGTHVLQIAEAIDFAARTEMCQQGSFSKVIPDILSSGVALVPPDVKEATDVGLLPIALPDRQARNRRPWWVHVVGSLGAATAVAGGTFAVATQPAMDQLKLNYTAARARQDAGARSEARRAAETLRGRRTASAVGGGVGLTTSMVMWGVSW